MQVGDRVRSKEGFGDTVSPGYEGELVQLGIEVSGTRHIEVAIDTLPSGYKLAPEQTMQLFSLSHKWEVIDG